MIEWMTTAEMLEKILKNKPFTVFESEDGVRVAKNRFGAIKFCDEKGNTFDGSVAHLTIEFLEAKWRILPKYVPFEEAMKALKHGKRVWLHVNKYKSILFTKNTYLENIYGVHGCSLNWESLFNGEWTIEEQEEEE